MARKEPLPLITELKRWRQQSGLSQRKAVRALNEAGISVTLYSLQSWEIGRWNPRAHVALALAEFLQQHSGRGRRKRSGSRKKDGVDQ